MTTKQILQGVHDWTNGKIVYDISVAHPDGQGKPTPYADLTAALGTGGANIPEELRKGGMSVKFIKGSAQSSDNKYIQARLMADSFTTDVTQWQGVDDEPTAGSNNLITSDGALSCAFPLVSFSNVYSTNGIYNVAGSEGKMFYKTNEKKIYRAVTYPFDRAAFYEEVPAKVNAIYKCNDKLYTWNGTDLVDNVQVTTPVPTTNHVEGGVLLATINGKKLYHQNIKLVAVVAGLSGLPDILTVGDVWYHKSQKVLKKCTVWTGDKTTSTYENVDFVDGAVYTYNNALYIVDSSNNLICVGKESETTPTSNSEKLITSGGVKTYVDGKETTINSSITKLSQEILKKCVFNLSDIVYPAICLISNGGLITRSSGGNKVAKMHLEAGKYWIYAERITSQYTLVKFTNSDFDTVESVIIPEQQVIGDIINGVTKIHISKVIELTEGYYAFGFKEGTSQTLSANTAFVSRINGSDEKYIKDYSHIFGVYGIGIPYFTDEGNSWTKNVDGSATSSATGIANRLINTYPTFEDIVDMSTDITPLSGDANGYYEVVFGKRDTTAGTAFSLGKDADGDYMCVYKFGIEQGLVPKHKFYFSGIECGINKTVTLRIEKRTDEYFTLNIYLYDKIGNCFSVSGIGNTETLKSYLNGVEVGTDSMSLGNGHINGNLHGWLCYVVQKGTAKVQNLHFGYPLDMQDIKLMICGHSLVEASTLTTNPGYTLRQRFASMIRSDIGEKKVAILGKGGAKASNFIEFFGNELLWMPSCKYILFFLASNDQDNVTSMEQMKRINDACISANMKPIWLTCNYRYVPNEDTDAEGCWSPNIDAYIRANFDYIDIKPMHFLADGVTHDSSIYLSTIEATHWNALGYQRLYNLIKAAKPEIWDC